jgi:hypothetical protein
MERKEPCLRFNLYSIYTFIKQIKENQQYGTSASKIKVAHAMKEYEWHATVQLRENEITLFGMV